MPTIDDYNRFGKNLERYLCLKTSPIAVKMLEKESDIPEGAIRPKKDKGYHLAQCQVFSMTRRHGMTIAMLKEDHWCWAPLLGYGLVDEPNNPTVDAFPTLPRFDRGKYIGIVTAPLKSVTFEPDMVLIYSNNAQLREMLTMVVFPEKKLVKSEFNPIDSCIYSIVPVILDGQYRITLPDPGEAERAFSDDDEIIFSVPKDKIEALAQEIAQRAARNEETQEKAPDWALGMYMPDFPRPDFYKDLFRQWGLDVED